MTDALMDRIKAHRSAPTVYDSPTFEQMADYIQELTLQLLAVHGQAADVLDKAVVAEAKLTKAMDVIKCILASTYANDHVGYHVALYGAKALLAELEGGK